MPNLWVRSQNKQRLSKVDDIYYVADGDFWSIRTNRSAFEYAGLYPTEQRCLEIIDEIQKLLMGGNPENAFIALKDCFYEDYDEIKQIVERAKEKKFIAVGGGADIEFMQPNVLVYEMPQE